MNLFDMVRLSSLMGRTRGAAEVAIGLIDGPVAAQHPAFSRSHLRDIPGAPGASCGTAASSACRHGTFVAGVLVADRDSGAPGIAPDCPLVVRPIFGEAGDPSSMPSAAPGELAHALAEVVEEGVRVVNISAALVRLSSSGEERDLRAALDRAATRGVVVVAAAGNQGSVGASNLTRHPAVVPVVPCDPHGRPLHHANLGSVMGRRGLRAPGADVPGPGSGGQLAATMSGSSAAAPIVTGAIALLWSEFEAATADEIRRAVLTRSLTDRRRIVPPLLDAEAAWQRLAAAHAPAYALGSR
jgi:subtilisin family serine protease